MTHCFVGIGSNETPEHYCKLMIAALMDKFEDIWVSSFCRSKASGVDANDYINCVVYITTHINKKKLKQWCQQLENKLGRVRQSIVCHADLDILLMTESLTDINHPFAIDSYYRELFKQIAGHVSKTTIEYQLNLSSIVFLKIIDSTLTNTHPLHITQQTSNAL